MSLLLNGVGNRSFHLLLIPVLMFPSPCGKGCNKKGNEICVGLKEEEKTCGCCLESRDAIKQNCKQGVKAECILELHKIAQWSINFIHVGL